MEISSHVIIDMNYIKMTINITLYQNLFNFDNNHVIKSATISRNINFRYKVVVSTCDTIYLNMVYHFSNVYCRKRYNVIHNNRDVNTEY